MAHQDVTDTIQVDLRFEMGNNNAANVLHVGYTGEIGIPDLDNLNEEFQTWLETSWKPIASELWNATLVTLTDINSLDGPRKAYPVDPVLTGDVTGGAPPASVTIAVKADIGRRGRGTAGRVFWIGLAESQLTENSLDVAVGSLILVALTTLNDAIALIPPFSGLVIPHRQVAGSFPNPATSSPVVGFLLTDYSIDVQKDRLPFHKKRKRTALPVIP